MSSIHPTDHSVAGNMSSYKAEGVLILNDTLNFRGSYQRVLRAPNIDVTNLTDQDPIVYPSQSRSSTIRRLMTFRVGGTSFRRRTRSSRN